LGRRDDALTHGWASLRFGFSLGSRRNANIYRRAVEVRCVRRERYLNCWGSDSRSGTFNSNQPD
jgi:hypothetical protein